MAALPQQDLSASLIYFRPVLQQILPDIVIIGMLTNHFK